MVAPISNGPSELPMPIAHTDPKHFTKAVTDLGSLRPVVTTSAIFNTTGIKIIEKGVAVDSGLYERLMQHQLSSPLEESVTSTPTVNGRRLRNDAAEVAQSAPFYSRMFADNEVRGIVLDILERIPLPPPIAFQLTLASEIQPGLYRHSLCTAMVAAWLAADSRLSRISMGTAAAAGLLHDLGMLHLDPLLLEYKTDISPAQRRQLYSHPLVAAVLLERCPEYPKDVVRAIVEHHEFTDGSGYPRGLTGDSICRTGKILALTELITGVFAPGREVPELRLSILLRMNAHRYDDALSAKVSSFLRPEADADLSISLLSDPIGRLVAIDGALADWPAEIGDCPDLTDQRRRSFQELSAQTAQLRRTLARVGAAPEQLEQLGRDALDRQLHAELTLLTKEAAWQLGTLSREVRRRCHAGPDTIYHAAMQKWLDRVDQAVTLPSS